MEFRDCHPGRSIEYSAWLESEVAPEVLDQVDERSLSDDDGWSAEEEEPMEDPISSTDDALFAELTASLVSTALSSSSISMEELDRQVCLLTVERDQARTLMLTTLAGKDAAIAERDAVTAEGDATLIARDQAIADRDTSQTYADGLTGHV